MAARHQRHMRVRNNRSLQMRLRDGLAGLAEGWRRDRSVRTHVILAGVGLLVLIGFEARSSAILTYLVLSALGLAAELLNGALEASLDRLHPADDADIGAAKDMSAAAALLVNLATIAVFVWALVP